MKYTLALYFFFLVFTIGCADLPESDEAQVGEVQQIDEQTTSPGLEINITESKISWTAAGISGLHNPGLFAASSRKATRGYRLAGTPQESRKPELEPPPSGTMSEAACPQANRLSTFDYPIRLRRLRPRWCGKALPVVSPG